VKEKFSKFGHFTSEAAGSPAAFIAAVALVLGWLASGPRFHYSEGWQLVINTGTTIVTFLMVFLIQNSQNRDGRVMQLKLDELIRAVKNARTQLVGLEDLSDAELDRLHQEFEQMRTQVAARREAREQHLASRRSERDQS
jgi:low affinity Fe/Cu permease